MGQGLAGSLLAYCLLQKGCKIVVIDAFTEGVAYQNYTSSSSIAAGVINPITGKRYVKSWRIDELLPEAREMYQAIEKLLKIPIWQERLLVRTLQNIEDENQWLLRSSYVDYAAYCSEKCTPSVSEQFEGTIHEEFHSFAEIKNAAQVHVPALVKHFRQHLIAQNCYFQDHFDYNDCILKEKSVFYKEFKAEKIIFCEGAKGVDNPYFKWLPFNLDKGELLIVKIPNFNLNNIFKHHISIVPLGDDLYWVGATNDWHFADDQPTESNKQLIVKELQSILKLPFEIIDHQAAIRPTVKDRRPFIGFHPDFEVVAIFNGFGTKGASLIPYWAKHFSSVLLRGGEVDKEVNIERYAHAKAVVQG